MLPNQFKTLKLWLILNLTLMIYLNFKNGHFQYVNDVDYR